MKLEIWKGRRFKRNDRQLPDPAKFFPFRILSGSIVEVMNAGNPREVVEVTVVKSPLYRVGISLVIPEQYFTEEYFETEC